MIAPIKRVFGEGFRVFFLAAGLYGLFTGIVWLIWLGVHAAGGMVELPSHAVAPHQWHAHEMIFGYATAAMGGFLLTAVPSWTKTPRRPGLRSSLQLQDYGSLGASRSGSPACCLSVWLQRSISRLYRCWQRRSWHNWQSARNRKISFFSCFSWRCGVAISRCISTRLGVWSGGADTGMRVGLLAVAGMIAVLGGRVAPAFTRNAMKRAGLPVARWPLSTDALDKLSLVLAVVLPWLVFVTAGEGVCCRGRGNGAWRCAGPAPDALARAVDMESADPLVVAPGHRTAWAWAHSLGPCSVRRQQRSRCPARLGHRMRRNDDNCSDEPRRSGSHRSGSDRAGTCCSCLRIDATCGIVALGRVGCVGHLLLSCGHRVRRFVVAGVCTLSRCALACADRPQWRMPRHR